MSMNFLQEQSLLNLASFHESACVPAKLISQSILFLCCELLCWDLKCSESFLLDKYKYWNHEVLAGSKLCQFNTYLCLADKMFSVFQFYFTSLCTMGVILCDFNQKVGSMQAPPWDFELNWIEQTILWSVLTAIMQTCIICCSLLTSCITWCAVCLSVQMNGSDLFPVLVGGSKPALCNQCKSPNNSIVLKEVMFCWPWTISPLPAKYRLSKVGLVFASCDEKPGIRKERKTWIISSSKRTPGRSLPGSFL